MSWLYGLLLVAIVGGVSGGGAVTYRWLQGHDEAVATLATEECQRKNAEAQAQAATEALAASKEIRDTEITALTAALAASKKITIIQRAIENVAPSPDCRRLGPDFIRLRNAAYSTDPTDTGPMPAPSARSPTATTR